MRADLAEDRTKSQVRLIDVPLRNGAHKWYKRCQRRCINYARRREFSPGRGFARFICAARINGDKQLRHINAIATFHAHTVKINFDKWLNKWISRSHFRITGALSDNCMIIYLRCLYILKKNI